MIFDGIFMMYSKNHIQSWIHNIFSKSCIENMTKSNEDCILFQLTGISLYYFIDHNEV